MTSPRAVVAVRNATALALVAASLLCDAGCGPAPAPAPAPVTSGQQGEQGKQGGDPAGAGAAKPAAPPAPPAVFVIGATCDDRFENEPCNKIRSGGLSSFAAAVDGAGEVVPRKFGILMGDLTHARGDFGRHVASPIFTEVLTLAGVNVVCAGEGELGLGVRYCRELLGSVQPRSQYNVLSANARERRPDGKLVRILRGSVLARLGAANSPAVHDAVVVAVAAESLQDELVRRGSDVVLDRAAPSAVAELAKRLREADDAGLTVATRLLLVHGTVAEARAILDEIRDLLPEGTPGFSFAVAAHGGVLPDLDPADAAGVPVFYAGRGLRFVWRVVVAGGSVGASGGSTGARPNGSLLRLGEQLILQGSPYRGMLRDLRTMHYRAIFETAGDNPDLRPPHPGGDFAGSAACASCHEDIAAEHAESAHATAPASLLAGPFATSTGCMPCHTTGAFWRSGWGGPRDATDFAGISCEACHGPGIAHVESPQPGYGAVDTDSCYRCHLPERSPEMDADALWEAFGHRQGKK